MNNSAKAGEKRMWGGRFAEPTAELVQRFTASVDFDQRLALHDIQGSIAHAEMLAASGVLSGGELRKIRSGLSRIQRDVEAGRFRWDPALEDVHMNIEARLTEVAGEAGKKLHTGRSRNDQVATDVRLFLRERIDAIDALLTDLMAALADRAEQHTETVMPGFTHLQAAQPVTFGHHLMAWFEMASRDRDRLRDCRRRLNLSPLGSAALAGTTFPIDRAMTATSLGFDGPTHNSLDSVSDRDFLIEFVSVASMTMMHLSRWCEEMVLWMSQQFGFIHLPDAYCTGSSIMPQKKNPDVPEIVRGKAARVMGHLSGLLVLMKGQPLAYNRDNQEDKEALFDSADTLVDCLAVITEIVRAMEPDAEAMRGAAEEGFGTATDLADYLVVRGVPFRDAHEIVGQAVAHAIERGLTLSQLALDTYRGLSPQIDEDVYEVLTLEGSISARDHVGGTAPSAVRAAIRAARERIDATE
ncbi:MAG: argininosuccinate lyase [Gammaproteobacteria bacterium]|nr:argininosuccinate lyase [Gammaproteobacteria bacterium]